MTKEEFRARMMTANLFELYDKVEPYMRTSIGLQLVKLDNEPIGISKIGGKPDLPPDFEWPVGFAAPEDFKDSSPRAPLPLSFIAQINLDEVKDLDEEGLLPTSGMLYFFFSADQWAWGHRPEDKNDFLVGFYEGNLDDLKPRDLPSDLPEMARFEARGVQPVLQTSIPSWERQLYGDISAEDFDLFVEVLEDMLQNKLLGFAENIQELMEEECEVVSRKAFGDPPHSPLDVKNAPENWQLLLQVDTNEDANMMWGDAGKIYFWIRKVDLMQGKFDRCWIELQCG